MRKIDKLLKTMICFIFAGTVLITTATPVHAKDTPTALTAPYQVVEVRINDANAIEAIKEAVITEEVKLADKLYTNHLDIKNSTITTDAFDITKVGTKNIKVLITLKSTLEEPVLVAQTISKVITLNVVDYVEPEIVLTTSTANIQNGSEFDPWSYIEYAYDNSQVYPNIVYVSNVDTTVNGDYTVTYAANDESGNKTLINLDITVSDRPSAITTIAPVAYNGDDIYYALDLINAQRVANGLNPYQLADAAGQAAAAVRAQEASAYVSHTRPDGSHYKTALDQAGAVYANWPLEILTYSGSRVEDKINWWMNSTGHRNILLNASCTTIALGVYNGMWCGIAY